jgi:hypothetical protein
VASIPACHAGDRGSIPRVGVDFAILVCNFGPDLRNEAFHRLINSDQDVMAVIIPIQLFLSPTYSVRLIILINTFYVQNVENVV